MNTAIIVAAGRGLRIGSDKPKQFLEIHGKPIIIHTLGRFDVCPDVDEIILVLPENETEMFGEILERFSIKTVTKIIAGGKTRAESVRNGLKAANEMTEIVAVHDGARPLVSIIAISRTIDAAPIAVK